MVLGMAISLTIELPPYYVQTICCAQRINSKDLVSIWMQQRQNTFLNLSNSGLQLDTKHTRINHSRTLYLLLIRKC